MLIPDFVPTWARDWHSRAVDDVSGDCVCIRQLEATSRLVSDPRMAKVYASLSRLNLLVSEREKVIDLASWGADMDWGGIRDSCHGMAARKRNLERLLREAADELYFMECEEGDGGSVPYVLASLPELFRVMDLGEVADKAKGRNLRDHLEQIIDIAAKAAIEPPDVVVPGVASRKRSEFASFIRWFENAIRENIQKEFVIPAARLFDLAAVALPPEFTPKRYSKNKLPEEYETDQQKSALIISIRKLTV